jgi:hypothetical protein
MSDLFILSGQEEERTPYDWDYMPEYEQEEQRAYAEIHIEFKDQESMDEFVTLLGQPELAKPSKRKRSIWYPKYIRGEKAALRWVSSDDPRYLHCEEAVL